MAACDAVPCGVHVDGADAIKSVIAKDLNDCHAVKVSKVAALCGVLTDPSCGVKLSLNDVFKASLVTDTCTGYAFKIFDVTTR